MTRKQLSELLASLEAVKNLKGFKFQYAIAKNKEVLQKEVEAIQSSINSTIKDEKFDEYEEKRIKLCVKFSEKDKNGSPVIENNSYKIEDLKAFNKALVILRDEYKEAVELRIKKTEEVKKFLDEEIPFEPYKILFENVPEDITGEQLQGIMPLIVDKL